MGPQNEHDIIGDVHGLAVALGALLKVPGYRNQRG